MKKLDQCLLKDVYAGYWKALPAVSDSLGSVFTRCSKKVFHYEAFCDDIFELTGICKVDAIALKKNNASTCVSLLEFKGGKTSENWPQEALAFKAIDTVLCGFPKFVDFDRSAWGSLFSDPNLTLNYYIIVSDEHVISTQEDELELVKNRNKPQTGKEQKINLKSKLKRYGNKHPFDKIEIVSASRFLKRVGKIVGDEIPT